MYHHSASPTINHDEYCFIYIPLPFVFSRYQVISSLNVSEKPYNFGWTVTEFGGVVFYFSLFLIFNTYVTEREKAGVYWKQGEENLGFSVFLAYLVLKYSCKLFSSLQWRKRRGWQDRIIRGQPPGPYPQLLPSPRLWPAQPAPLQGC